MANGERSDTVPRGVGIDIAQLAATGNDPNSGALPAASAVAGAASESTPTAPTQVMGRLAALEDALRPHRAFDETMKRITGLAGAHSGLGAFTDHLAHRRSILDALQLLGGPAQPTASIAAAAARAIGQLSAAEEVMRPFDSINDRMKRLAELAGGHSTMGMVAQQIAEQQRAIDALRIPNSFVRGEPDHIHASAFQMPELPPNPILETNRRLERIEQRFEEMHDVAANAATIANGLQAHAAEFLVKFEKAANDNARSAGRAIWLAAIAVLLAIAMPLVQIIYTEFWRVPTDVAYMQAVISDMHREIGALRQIQADAAERVDAALMRSDQQAADILQGIRRMLAEQRLDLVGPGSPAN